MHCIEPLIKLSFLQSINSIPVCAQRSLHVDAIFAELILGPALAAYDELFPPLALAAYDELFSPLHPRCLR